MNTHALRFKPNQDLKKELLNWTVQNNIHAACIVTCVGSFTQAHLRFAHQKQGNILKGHFEIVSMEGTFSKQGAHFHLSISNEQGHVVGGHMLEGCLIHTTAEVVIGILEDDKFARIHDPETGFQELFISKK